MYVKYYGLKIEPFRLSPDHSFCLSHPSFKRAHAYMQYALLRREGFVVVTGLPGTGKTTLIGELLTDFDSSDFTVARLVSSRLQDDDLLRMVCYAFDIPAVDDAGKALLLQRLTAFVRGCFERNRRPLLIVDEAQGLNASALEELRLLTNQQVDGQQMLQIFLVGQEELRDHLAEPGLEQLRQRIVAACHIEPLQPDQTLSYVLHRLQIAGWHGRPRLRNELFPPLYKYSRGIPRLINQVCSRLLLHGSLEEKQELGAEDIELVISELRAEHLSPEQSSNLLQQAEDFDFSALDSLQHELEAAQLRQTSPLPRVDSEAGSNDRPASIVASVDDLLAADARLQVDTHQSPAPRAVAPAPLARPAVKRRAVLAEPLWGLAASVVLAALISATVLVTVPRYELERIASETLWDDLGVTRARALLSHWSGGSWPLAKPRDKTYKPAVKRGVEEIARISRSAPAALPANGQLAGKVAPAELAPAEPKRTSASAAEEVESTVVPADLSQAVPAAAVDEDSMLVETSVSHVSFAFDSAEIRPEYWQLLDDLASELSASRDSRAQIIGFTDDVGPSEYNKVLSQRRASAVADYLREKGGSQAQLQIEGRGSPTVADAGLQSVGPRTVRIYLTSGDAGTRLISYGGD